VVLRGELKLMLILPYHGLWAFVGASVGAIACYLQSKRLFPAFKATAGVLIIGYVMALLPSESLIL